MNGIIDIHCHLDDAVFDVDRHEIIERCMAAGFERLVVVADPFNERSVETTLMLMERYKIVYGMCAAHPHAAKDYCPVVEERIKTVLGHNKCIGLGEAGLDYNYNFSPPDVQKEVFARQIDLAKAHKLPLTIHSRQAEEDVLAILDQQAFTGKLLFHCYTGSLLHAQRILERGGYLSFSGIITFPKADSLREVLKITPLERMFIETDAPYLAPVPERGKRNSPEFLPHTLKAVAAIKRISETDFLAQIRANYLRLF